MTKAQATRRWSDAQDRRQTLQPMRAAIGQKLVILSFLLNRPPSKINFCSIPNYITLQSTHTADQIDALNYDSAPVRLQTA
jgi:hypothetical protein